MAVLAQKDWPMDDNNQPQQQQQQQWTPSITAQPFYPSFYQPQHQQPYFDPWAYQQMMLQQTFNQAQYAGFHPYRRPARQPYSRPDAAASSSSVSSTHSQRQRTDSNNSNSGSSRTASPVPHHRASSSSSSIQSSNTNRSPRTPRPSPLSQATFTTAEKRMSRDDSTLKSNTEPMAAQSRSSGLKGRLRRAFTMNPSQEEDKATASHPEGDDNATGQPKKRGRAASLFNARMNISTDNISLSSTVSSASVMIRKLGSMGRLARRNSLAGITSLFKDKDKDKDDDKKGKKKDKKGSKSEASEASVSHVTAELDRSAGDWSVGAEMSGLTPAAKLARQHTLKSNAEAAAKAKAQQEVANGNGAGVPAWEKNTATRQASPVKRVAGMHVNEDGTRVLVEEDDEDEDDDDIHYGRPHQDTAGWDDDDDDWDEDEDVTIRMQRASIDDSQEDVEPWAVDIRRSVERTRVPTKGILKYAANYDQQRHLGDAPIPSRVRSNSYNSHSGQQELGPLARIPSPDPDHIDGLHRHGSHSSAHSHSPSHAPSLPPLSFESSPLKLSHDSSSSPSTPTSVHHPPTENRPLSIYNHPNSSAPVLSKISSPPPTMTHRSATAPPKKISFATNLSIYDTFSAATYDRRSEPATWSRLTPALAQRIKEELNSYKMEEMEVHAASRIHTQFFV